MAPYLGSYRNAALGDVELRLEEGRLLVDVGEFASELHATNAEGTAYVVTTPPFPGVEWSFAMEGGEPTLVMGQGAEAYPFVRR